PKRPPRKPPPPWKAPPRKPPPWNPPPWKPPPPPWKPPPPPPWPPPPPPWPAAHPACARAIDVMPTKLSNLNFFISQDRYSCVLLRWCIRGILRSFLRVILSPSFEIEEEGLLRES